MKRKFDKLNNSEKIIATMVTFLMSLEHSKASDEETLEAISSFIRTVGMAHVIIHRIDLNDVTQNFDAAQAFILGLKNRAVAMAEKEGYSEKLKAKLEEQKAQRVEH